MKHFTKKQASEMLGISDRHIDRLRKRGMPFDPTDIQTIAKCAVWIEHNTSPEAAGWGLRKDDEAKEQRESLTDRLKRIQIERGEEDLRAKRIENDEKSGKLVSVDAVEQRITQWITKIRSHLMQLAGDISDLVPGPLKSVVKKAAEDKIRSTLSMLYEGGIRDDRK